LAALSACEAPFGLGLPSTLALESGVAGSLSGAASFEIAGSYVDAGVRWTVDLQLVRPQTEHALVTQGTTQLEAVVVGGKAFFRGQDFLSVHLGAASSARTLVRAAGHAWWTGTTADLPDPTDFTNGARFRLTFLGPVVNLRTDQRDRLLQSFDPATALHGGVGGHVGVRLTLLGVGAGQESRRQDRCLCALDGHFHTGRSGFRLGPGSVLDACPARRRLQLDCHRLMHDHEHLRAALQLSYGNCGAGQSGPCLVGGWIR